jgi:adenine/guanine phosphoribosyltransferase-like PRPP-binding protein
MPLSHTQVHEGRRENFLPGPNERRIHLATGDLEITINRADLDLEDLCDFAARQNPKRGFLFVSKVLGRHLPARPSIMRDVHCRLAEKIPADLPGPVVIIGLAETATCLGQGVHSQYLARVHRSDVLFIHTTRHRLDRSKAFDFIEEHSHAAQHSVYMPEVTEDRVLFKTARSVVLVDDEVSTGGTLMNLIKALSGFNTCLEQSLCLTLTDWRGAKRAKAGSDSMLIPSSWMSLLDGEYRFYPRITKPPATSLFGNQAPGNIACSQRNNGRLGLRTPPALTAGIVEGLSVSSGERILVLGTGEFCYLPFRLAEALEARGCEVFCQATTRSPTLIGHAIRCSENFPDSYGGAFQNFVYNVEPESYDRIFLCSETPAEVFPPGLLHTLRAVPLVL